MFDMPNVMYKKIEPAKDQVEGITFDEVIDLCNILKYQIEGLKSYVNGPEDYTKFNKSKITFLSFS